jgi:hypothetical protein
MLPTVDLFLLHNMQLDLKSDTHQKFAVYQKYGYIECSSKRLTTLLPCRISYTSYPSYCDFLRLCILKDSTYVYKICIAVAATNVLICFLSFILLFALLLLSYPVLTALEPHFGHVFSLCSYPQFIQKNLI